MAEVNLLPKRDAKGRFLKGTAPKQQSATAERRKNLEELVRASEEAGLYDLPPILESVTVSTPVNAPVYADVHKVIARGALRAALLKQLEGEIFGAMATRAGLVHIYEARKITFVDCASAAISVIDRFLQKHGKDLV